jgi:hypothetical protein
MFRLGINPNSCISLVDKVLSKSYIIAIIGLVGFGIAHPP